MQKALIIVLLALLAPSASMAARQTVNDGEGMGIVRSKINAMTTELYSLAIAAPWLAQTTAPSITNVFWVDTSGTSPVIKYWDGDSWEVAASGEGGTYTLPVATSSTLGGVKQGARVTIAADGTLSADVQATDISGKENSLGNPSVNGYVLSSTTGGIRSWIEMTGGGTGIAHATSDGNYYASLNGAWASLNGVYASALGTDDNYATDAEKVKLANLSGTNTGDQTLPTAASLSVDDLITLSGVATGAVNLGTFTGSTIADSSTVKAAFQAVETKVETKADSANITFIIGALTDLKILDTAQPANGSVWVDDTLAYGATDDNLHLWSIDKVGSQLALKIGASSTDTLTNKTLDTAGTGNSITVPLNGALDGAITDPADADDMIYVRAANAMTVTGIDCQAEGTTPSITVTLQKCNDLACGTPTTIEAAITCDADGGAHASTIDSAAITADTPIKVLFGAPSGTVTSVRWRVVGTQTW